MTQRPWSKLQREIYDLLTPTINLQIHCTRYPMRSQKWWKHRFTALLDHVG
ncbi:hypothetical protein I6C92_002834 [Escherichia coli]|nr:hypothetical protein [Escherichia coli]GDP75443.1 hypothetical protein BvCmsOUNP013_03875 [Escherichia coli]